MKILIRIFLSKKVFGNNLGFRISDSNLEVTVRTNNLEESVIQNPMVGS